MRRSDDHFRLNNGRLCFTFAATLGKRGEPNPLERLNKPADLARWCADMGFCPMGLSVSEAELSQALELRETIVTTARALIHGQALKARDVDYLNEWAAGPALSPQLQPEPVPHLHWSSPGATIEAILALIARDCIELLGGDLASRIKSCADDTCQGLFVDTSRPGSRRWCAMGTCGNRAKKAALRQRQGIDS